MAIFPQRPRSRGSTGRSALEPSGNTSFDSVSQGNLITCRTLVLLWVAAALNAWWILEQPKNSLMQELPAFQSFMNRVKTYRFHMKMSEYGGPTEKPTWLYSGYLACSIKLMSTISFIFWVFSEGLCLYLICLWAFPFISKYQKVIPYG